jgi:5-oxopent-3-ene-1,2,5-tricarboxylate decarboxylase/2-hydroxyhepta-2,4-diene-1,7-dioate isomerase
VPDPNALEITVEVDGVVAQRASTARHVRNAAKLISDISEFMTLDAGDLLLLGTAPDAPRVRAGQQVRMTAAGLTALEFAVAAEVSA